MSRFKLVSCKLSYRFALSAAGDHDSCIKTFARLTSTLTVSFVLSSLRRTARLCPTTAANPPSTSDRPAAELAGSPSHLGPAPSGSSFIFIFYFPATAVALTSDPLPHDEAAGLFVVGPRQLICRRTAPRFSRQDNEKIKICIATVTELSVTTATCHYVVQELKKIYVNLEDVSAAADLNTKTKKGERCHICLLLSFFVRARLVSARPFYFLFPAVK